MNKEFWTYGKIYGIVQQVFKINESSEFLSIHQAAQILMDNRKYSMVQAYEYLNLLHQ